METWTHQNSGHFRSLRMSSYLRPNQWNTWTLVQSLPVVSRMDCACQFHVPTRFRPSASLPWRGGNHWQAPKLRQRLKATPLSLTTGVVREQGNQRSLATWQATRKIVVKASNKTNKKKKKPGPVPKPKPTLHGKRPQQTRMASVDHVEQQHEHGRC
jgi:hypothetical protein